MTEKYPAPLTLLQADLYAREVVAEQGTNFVYQKRRLRGTRSNGITINCATSTGCLYVHNGTPDCVVGRILYRHGVPLDILAQWEGITAGDMGPLTFLVPPGSSGTRYRRTLGEEGLMTREAARFLSHLQMYQDASREWGEALSEALAEARWFAVKHHSHTPVVA